MAALRVGIVAGEPSGDQLGAALIEGLRAQHSDIEIHAMAGPRMQAAGCRTLAHIDELSVMGLWEVLKHYPRLRRLQQRLIAEFSAIQPNVFIGIDVPDFVLELEAALKARQILTVHWVCPQVWAWRPERVKRLKRAANLLLTLFPFEVPFLKEHAVDAEFVGHPLADRIPLVRDERAARSRLGLPVDATLIGLLPGSRRQEYERHLPLFLEVAARLHHAEPKREFLLGVVNERAAARAARFIADLPFKVHLLTGQASDLLSAANVALCVSGTITLEAALNKTPAVVAYRMPWLTHAILRRMVRVSAIALPNLLMRKALIPEFIQSAATPEALTAALEQWLVQPEAVANYRHDCATLHHQLRNNAGMAAANSVLRLLRQQGTLT